MIGMLLDGMQSLEEKGLAEFLRQNSGIENVLKDRELMERLSEKQKVKPMTKKE